MKTGTSGDNLHEEAILNWKLNVTSDARIFLLVVLVNIHSVPLAESNLQITRIVFCISFICIIRRNTRQIPIVEINLRKQIYSRSPIILDAGGK